MNILGRFLPDLWYSPADVLLRASEVFIWQRVLLVSPSLDIGCGDGDISKRTFSFPDQIDVGIDLRPVATSNLYHQMLQADATKHPFKNSSFQTVISNSTCEHIKADTKAVSEVTRILKPGGKFYLTVPTPRLRPFLSNQINARVAHLHYRSATDWQKLLAKNNLVLKKVEYYFPPASVSAWLLLFKLATFKIYHRELWSYLKDSPYSRLFPSRFISQVLKIYLSRYIATDFSEDGTWQFITAVKK